MEKYDFSHLKEDQLVDLGRDLLNKGFNLNLQKEEKILSEFIPDLVQFRDPKKKEVFAVAEVFGKRGFREANYDSAKARLESHHNVHHPDELIFLLFDRHTILTDKLEKDLGSIVGLRVLTMDWVESHLEDAPDLVEKWKLEMTGTAPIDRSSYQKEFEAVLRELRINDVTEKERSFFVGGYDWGGENQLSRFLVDGVWENGWDNKFVDVVNSVKVGDVFFIKSTVRKGKKGYLKLRAIGIVLQNPRNGKILKINWFEFPYIIESKRGSHLRNAIQVIGDEFVDDILRAVLDQYAEFPSIIEDLMNGREFELWDSIDTVEKKKIKVDSPVQPIDHTDILKYIQKKLEELANSWWLNAAAKWTIDQLNVGDIESYGAKGAAGHYQKYVKQLEVGDLLICYQAKPDRSIVGLLQITQLPVKEERYYFKLIYKFEIRTTLEELKKLPLFGKSSLSKTLQGSLHKLKPDLFQEIINTTELGNSKKPDPNNSKKQNQSMIANLSHDAIDGEDYLGIDKDVTAFAKVITSNNFTPPLAIALFGQWGTGKSFFMKKLMKRIDELSNSGNSFYRTGIAQIHFNAWSYLDTNLFASIVSEVFEKLDEYISGNKKSDVHIKKIEKELTDRLSVAGKQQELLRKKKEAHIKKIRGLRKKIIEKNEESNKQIAKIKANNAQRIFEEVEKELKIQEQLQGAVASISLGEDDLKEVDPNSLLKELKSGQNFLRESIKLAKGDIRGLILFIVILLATVGLSFLPMMDLSNFVVPQTALVILAPIPVIWKSIIGTINCLTPVISKVNSIKDQQDKLLKETKSRYNQEELAVKLEIERRNIEISSFNEEIYTLESDFNRINYLLKHNLKQRAVYSFINERSKSEEYQKYLGVVSTIRKDFETLSDLFDQSKIEGKAFRDHFEKPLERIVLYIDDLDRCKEDQVIQVLEAVNLLMAFPLFVVVVGVDPRWVKNALIKEYHMQFANVDDKDELGIVPIEASNYLEKIFQVPFHLEEPRDTSVKQMLFQLSKTNISETEDDGEDALGDKTEPRPKTKTSDTKPNKKERNPQETPTSKPAKKDSELLSLSKREVELLQEMSRIIGTNPRAIKRFVNVYYIVRSHEGLGSAPSTDKEYLILMLLLALPIGPYRTIGKVMENHSEKKEKKFGIFLEENLKNESGQFKELKDYVSETSVSEELLDLSLEEMNAQNKFIRRFTFSELA